MSKPTPTILLVDDEAHVRKFLTLVVKALSPERVLEAADGEDALTLVESERPDLVLLDINMPGRDGLTILPLIKAAAPDCTVVMLTSLTTRQTVEDALDTGADGYIRKDTPREEILRQLLNALAPDDDSAAS